MIRVGDTITTPHGTGIVRALSKTSDCLTSIDIELIRDGKTIGWICIPPDQATSNES